MREVGDRITAFDKEVSEVETGLQALTAAIPNIPNGRTPIGASEDENVVLRTEGQLPNLTLCPKHTGILGRRLASSILSAAQRSRVLVFMS